DGGAGEHGLSPSSLVRGSGGASLSRSVSRMSSLPRSISEADATRRERDLAACKIPLSAPGFALHLLASDDPSAPNLGGRVPRETLLSISTAAAPKSSKPGTPASGDEPTTPH